MSKNIFKILLSLPIILITLYYIPFLGICLILTRLCVGNTIFSRKSSKNSSSMLFTLNLFSIGLLTIIPKLINSLFKLLKLDENLTKYLNDLVNSDIYEKLFKYGKFLITIGLIFYIISFLFKKFSNKVENKISSDIKDYFNKINKENINKSENNIKEKYDNYLKEKNNKKDTNIKICSYCRTKINKDKFCPNCGALIDKK